MQVALYSFKLSHSLELRQYIGVVMECVVSWSVKQYQAPIKLGLYARRTDWDNNAPHPSVGAFDFVRFTHATGVAGGIDGAGGALRVYPNPTSGELCYNFTPKNLPAQAWTYSISQEENSSGPIG